MAVTCCKSNDRLIEQRSRSDYDLDQLRAEMHPSGGAVPRGRPQRRPRALGFQLRRLNGPEIKQERTRVLAGETKRRHIRMADHEPFAQSLHERIKIDAAIERAEGGRANVRAPATLADGMTLRAHSF